MRRKVSAEPRSSIAETPEAVLDQKAFKAERKRWLFRMTAEMVFIAAAVYLLFGVFFGIGYVKGTSMQPYLQPGDAFVFSRICKYQAGDVVLLRQDVGDDYIKRIVGTPGQTVDFDAERGTVVIDGEEYSEPYIYKKTYAGNEFDYPLALAGDEYYLLGDNRSNSSDSRGFGAVKEKELDGKVFLVLRWK